VKLDQRVFLQLIDHLPRYEFQKYVSRYQGDYQRKSFSSCHRRCGIPLDETRSIHLAIHCFNRRNPAVPGEEAAARKDDWTFEIISAAASPLPETVAAQFPRLPATCARIARVGHRVYAPRA